MLIRGVWWTGYLTRTGKRGRDARQGQKARNHHHHTHTKRRYRYFFIYRTALLTGEGGGGRRGVIGRRCLVGVFHGLLMPTALSETAFPPVNNHPLSLNVFLRQCLGAAHTYTSGYVCESIRDFTQTEATHDCSATTVSASLPSTHSEFHQCSRRGAKKTIMSIKGSCAHAGPAQANCLPFDEEAARHPMSELSKDSNVDPRVCVTIFFALRCALLFYAFPQVKKEGPVRAARFVDRDAPSLPSFLHLFVCPLFVVDAT
jgi:hypothetical protein